MSTALAGKDIAGEVLFLSRELKTPVIAATFAALVGGGGLGRYVVDGFGLQDPAELYGGVVLVALLSVAVELVLAAVQRRITRRTGTREPEVVTAS